MSSQPSSSATAPFIAGRWAGPIIFFVVALCIGMIGLSAYVKYQLDRAESSLTAPESLLTPEQQSLDKVRRVLGYGGFLGLAQNFASAHDATTLPDMRAAIKQAEDGLDKLPEKANAETRQDLQVILSTFRTALAKAEKSTASGGQEFATTDLAPLYAALPVLDNRVASAIAADRTAVQDEAQMWATYLTVICWGSLIIASTLAAGIFLVLRDRNSAPMRALAQSVKNMARGDMRTPIWGMERQDAIGDLARSVDMARFHFSQLPDMSLLSDQGPVRIRFEGNTRSLFEAMMRVISRDSEQVHQQATTLSEAVQKQQDTLAHVIERVEAVLLNVEKRAVNGDQQVRQALQGMLTSAESLKNAQERASGQLNRIIPYLEDRTQGLSEIAQITGKQVSQALQSLALSERNLKTSAEQSEAAIRKFSDTADTLGERMFGAVNLLQASGKVLAETTESARSRFDEAIERIGSATMPAAATPPVDNSQVMEKLENAVAALEGAQGKLQIILNEQVKAARAHIDLLTTQSNGLLTQASTTSQTLLTSADRLREEESKLSEIIEKIRLEVTGRDVEAKAQGDTARMVVDGMKQGFTSLEQHLAKLHGQLASLLVEDTGGEDKTAAIAEQMRDHWYQMAAQIEATRANLADVIMQQVDRIDAHVANIAKKPADSAVNNEWSHDPGQMEQQTQILNELVTTLSLLDAHMQELRTQVTSKAG